MSKQCGCGSDEVCPTCAFDEIGNYSELIKAKDAEIERLIGEVVKRNQYKINEEYLKNIHTYYEKTEADNKVMREALELIVKTEDNNPHNHHMVPYNTIYLRGIARETLLKIGKGEA